MIQDTSSQDVILDNHNLKFSINKILILLSILSLVIIFLFKGFSNWLASDRTVAKARIQIATVKRGQFTRDIALQGIIVAANSPKLYAPAIGNITLLAKPGEFVKKGDRVAVLNSPELTNRLQQQQAKLDSLEIELERKKINTKKEKIKSRQKIQLEKVVLDAAEREMRRAEKSIKIKAISLLDYEKAIDDLKRSKLKHTFAIEQAALENENLAFEIKTAEFEKNQYALLVDNTSRLVKELKMLAPVSGIVGSWSVEQKSAVSINQPLLTIVDLTQFEVEIDIPENYADKIGLGMPVYVQYNQQKYPAKISTISPEVKQNIVKARAKFTATPPPGIKQNQRVYSQVILEEKNNVLFLPRGSFVQHHNGRKIFVVKNNIALLRDIQTGSSSIDKIEVISGLNAGEQVIISNTDFVKNASTLTIKE